MESSKIPNLLTEKYNVYKEENLKYSCLKIDNFENEYINKENSMLNSLNSFKQSLESIFEKISDIILNNNNTFNDTCLENGIKSIDYLFIIKSILYLISTIISKLENKEIENESFQSLYENISKKFQKILDVQYPKDNSSIISNLENYVKSVVENANKIKNEENSKPGSVLTTLITLINIKLIPQINESIEKFKEIKNFKDTSYFNNQTKAHEMILFDLLQLLKRIKNLNDFIYFGYFIDEKDLVNIKEASEEWADLKKLIWTVKPKKNLDVEKIMAELSETMQMRMAQMRKMRENGGSKLVGMIGNVFNNLFNSSQAKYDFKKFLIQLYGFPMEPPNKTMKMNSMMKKMITSRLPSIECRKKLYLRKEYKPITLEYIVELNDFLNGKITEPKDKNLLLFNGDYKLSEEMSKKCLFSTKLEKTEKDSYVSTRLMNNSPLLFKGEKLEKGGYFNFGQQTPVTEHKNEFKNTLIIHINGGGFRSNMSLMMERFLRDWSKDLGCALMTIKKPEKDEDQYPATLNQFYQVYMWLINHAKDELNMDIKKIIISGDSAGGNLAMSFLYLLIGINLFEKTNIKIPDLAMLEYPNLSLEVNKMSNSICLGAYESNYGHEFFKNLVDYYLGDFKDYKNMFVSPLYASKMMIDNLPRIRVFFGNQDVSRDDFLRGIYNLRNCKDIRAYNFLSLPHGFNGINHPDLFEMVKDFIIEEVKEIINSN